MKIIIDVCYNSIINKYKKDNYYNFNNNNLNMYHYYDMNQRRIEKIIPKINEYLNNNSYKKKLLKKNFFIRKNNKEKNNMIQQTFNNFSHEYKKNKKNLNLFNEENKDNIKLFLYNSINSDINIMNNNKKNKRDFSCKVPCSNRRRKNKLEFEKMSLNIDNNKYKKIRIGMFRYLSSTQRKNFDKLN